jgi:hypothetical protein
MNRHRRLPRWLLLIGFGVLGGVLVPIVFMLYDAYAQTHSTPSKQWVQLALVTVGAFCAAASYFKKSWSTPSFWLTLSGLLIAHLVVFVPVFEYFPDWRGYSIGGVVFVESMALTQLLSTMGYDVAP